MFARQGFIAFVFAYLLSACFLHETFAATDAKDGDFLKVRVSILTHSKLPALDDKGLKEVLRIAEVMISRSYGRKVRFTIIARHDYLAFVRAQNERINPWVVPRNSYFDIFDDDADKYRDSVIEAIKKYGTVAELRSIIPAKDRGRIKTFEQAGAYFLGRYKGGIEHIKTLKTIDGKPLITRGTWRLFSLQHGDQYIASLAPKSQYDLWLSNTLIIDDLLGDPAPHGLLRSVAHGVAHPASLTAHVAYHPLIADDPLLTGFSFRLKKSYRRLAIARVIAHEVGTHLLMQQKDRFQNRYGLGVPIVSHVDQLKNSKQWARAADAPRIDMAPRHFGKALLRVRIAIAQRNAEVAQKEYFRIEEMAVKDEWKAYVKKMMFETDWEKR